MALPASQTRRSLAAFGASLRENYEGEREAPQRAPQHWPLEAGSTGLVLPPVSRARARAGAQPRPQAPSPLCVVALAHESCGRPGIDRPSRRSEVERLRTPRALRPGR